MSFIELNLFRLVPSEPEMRLFYYPETDTVLVNILRSLNVSSACMPNDFENIAKGVYFEPVDLNDLIQKADQIKDMERRSSIKRGLMKVQIRLKEVTIPSAGYVIKYLLTHVLSNKLRELAQESLIKIRRRGYGVLEFYFSSKNSRSKQVTSQPYGLLSLNKCYFLRVQYLSGNLYLQLQTSFRIFSSLTLDKVLSIMLADNRLSLQEASRNLVGLPVIFSLNKEGPTLGYIGTLGYEPSTNEYVVEIVCQDRKIIKQPTKQVRLNLIFNRTKKFLEKTLGEKISNFEQIRRQLSIKTPLSKMKEEISSEIVEIKKLLFPLKLNNIQYDLNTDPLKITLPS